MADPLKTYAERRDLEASPEPAPEDRQAPGGRRFTIHRHDASQLHYDLRLEVGGVMKSWAITKGPSLDPSDKRLAVATDDHPVSYGDFEGTIPEDEYGAGTVMLWDYGRWVPDKGLPQDALEDGELTFELFGEKLKGKWALVHMGTRSGNENWLLIKQRDEAAKEDTEAEDLPARSAKTGYGMETIEEKSGDGRVETKDRRGSASPPDFRKPQLATLVEAPPEGDEWLHEMKYDGYRLIAAVGGGKARLYTRNGKDWSERFPQIVEALEDLNVESALIDGEAAVLKESGLSDFSALQESLSKGRKDIVFFAFDLLELDGEDFTDKALEHRKGELSRVFSGVTGALRYADHVAGRGDAVYDKACEAGAEGIVSKKKTSKYRAGRKKTWQKVKCTLREEAVIAGWSPSDKDRPFSSLILATNEDGDWVYRGRVGTGFSAGALDAIGEALQEIERKTSPLKDTPDEVKDARWVTPKLVAEIEYAERTKEGRFRHASFLGIREDKEAEEVSAEAIEPDDGS